jgi:hypothetical protein
MPPSASTCAIPKGIFDGVEGAMLQGIAYGEELNLAHPPRPADPKVTWEPIWAVKVRVKSTGMTPLGMEDEGGSRSSRRGQRQPPRDSAAPAQQAPQTPQQAPSPVDEAADAVNKLKGLFKF